MHTHHHKYIPHLLLLVVLVLIQLAQRTWLHVASFRAVASAPTLTLTLTLTLALALDIAIGPAPAPASGRGDDTTRTRRQCTVPASAPDSEKEPPRQHYRQPVCASLRLSVLHPAARNVLSDCWQDSGDGAGSDHAGKKRS